MLVARNSVMSRLRCKQPALVALHCQCHIAALIANEACKVLPDELEDLTTDVWYYFQKSQRRLRQFEEFQSFVECKPHKLLKACQTWWLSLACVNRLIEQYEALLSYFQSIKDKQAVVRRVKIVLEKPLTKAYLLFLCSTLPIVNNFNSYMQQQSPIHHVLYQELDGLIQNFCCGSWILSTCLLLNMFHKCVLITQKCISLYTKFSYVTTHYHTLKKRMDYHLKMWENLGRLSKLGGLLQPGSSQTNTYESQVTLQSQMASTKLTTIQYGWSGACCSRVCSSGSSSWW